MMEQKLKGPDVLEQDTRHKSMMYAHIMYKIGVMYINSALIIDSFRLLFQTLVTAKSPHKDKEPGIRWEAQFWKAQLYWNSGPSMSFYEICITCKTGGDGNSIILENFVCYKNLLPFLLSTQNSAGMLLNSWPLARSFWMLLLSVSCLVSAQSFCWVVQADCNSHPQTVQNWNPIWPTTALKPASWCDGRSESGHSNICPNDLIQTIDYLHIYIYLCVCMYMKDTKYDVERDRDVTGYTASPCLRLDC